MACLRDDIPSQHRIPNVKTEKNNGHFKLATGKAANAKYLFYYYALSIFEGLVPPLVYAAIVLTVEVTHALCVGVDFTDEMIEALRMLLWAHHAALVEAFGAAEAKPNWHTCTWSALTHFVLTLTAPCAPVRSSSRRRCP